MGDKPKDEETSEPKSFADKVLEKADALIELRTQEILKAQEKPGPTDPTTRPDLSAAQAPETSALDERFTRKKTSFFPHRAETLPEDVRKNINVNLFPRGDLDNFSMARYAMAAQRYHYLGEPRAKSAPWETMFYDAAKAIQVFDPVTKAQGDMVSGQDGGFLAPEFWATNFLDQLYAAQVVTQLPITTLPMGTRVN